jgi:hypothetical protein
MKKFTILAVLSLISCANPASAQQSVTLRKDQLQKVEWFKAPLNIQIVDERPRVNDTRGGDEAPQDFVIPIGPIPSSSAGGNQSVKMVSNRLAPSGFQTTIPARKNIRPLNQVKIGGLTPVATPARPIGALKPGCRNIPYAPALATNRSTPVAATYRPSKTSSGYDPSQFGSQSGFSKDVLARLRHGD